MKSNVGKIDKIIRTIIGLSLIIIGVIFDNFIWIFGILLLFSAYYSFCLLYKFFNITTLKNNKSDNNCNCGCK